MGAYSRKGCSARPYQECATLHNSVVRLSVCFSVVARTTASLKLGRGPGRRAQRAPAAARPHSGQLRAPFNKNRVRASEDHAVWGGGGVRFVCPWGAGCCCDMQPLQSLAGPKGAVLQGMDEGQRRWGRVRSARQSMPRAAGPAAPAGTAPARRGRITGEGLGRAPSTTY